MGSILSEMRAERWITGTKKLERLGATSDDWDFMVRDEEQARRVALTMHRRGPLNPTHEGIVRQLFGDHRTLDSRRWKMVTEFHGGGQVAPTAELVPVDECDLYMTDQLDQEKRLFESCRPLYIGSFADGSPVTIANYIRKHDWSIRTGFDDTPWPKVLEQPYAQIPLASGWYLVRHIIGGYSRVPKWEDKPRRIMFHQARAVEYFLFVLLDRYLRNYTHLGPESSIAEAKTHLAICRDVDQAGQVITTAVGTIPYYKSEIVLKEINEIDDTMGVGMVAYLG